MSQRQVKAARRAEGISKQARDAEREFRDDVARRRAAIQERQRQERDAALAALIADVTQPTPRRDGRRKALAWTGLALIAIGVALLAWWVASC